MKNIKYIRLNDELGCDIILTWSRPFEIQTSKGTSK